ncbi:hypothetical protein X943_003588 [Babesia divergens]|uniref:Uncharacterized protein n=1 Tax=Babesia divergens TaxID=32595 RepID=A0AAD9GK16_BABDI|nr:hypothetical protein X943_003588 [Babesia divergens]
MALLLKILALSIFATLVSSLALTESGIQRSDVDVDAHNSTSPERLLSGVSRRKYFPSGSGALTAAPANIASMDEDDFDDDDEEEEDDDDEGDYHHFNMGGDGSAAKVRLSGAAESRNAPKVVPSEAVDAKRKPLLMSSLPAHTEGASAAPESATDVIGNYIGSCIDGFHRVMNEFFENIDKQIEKNRALPLLEHGDTFF